MYDINKLVKSFSTLVGWKDTNLNTTESGLYYQEAHPLLTLRALKGVMPKDMASNYPPYEQGRVYDKGAEVSNAGKVYTSLQADNNQPLENTSYWGEVNLFERYLTSITERGIKKAIIRFVN